MAGRRSIRAWAPVAGLAIVILTAGACGSGGSPRQEPSNQDQAATAAIVREVVTLGQSFAPLAGCLQATRGGQCALASFVRLRTRATLTFKRLKKKAATVRGSCLQTGLKGYVQSVAAMRDFADAMVRRDDKSANKALDAQLDEYGAGVDKFAACGRVDPKQSFGLQFSLAYRRINRVVTPLQYCHTRPCFQRVGRDIATASSAALRRLEPLVPNQRGCFRQLALTDVKLMRTLRRLGEATRQINPDAMDRLTNRAEALYIEATTQGRRCLFG